MWAHDKNPKAITNIAILYTYGSLCQNDFSIIFRYTINNEATFMHALSKPTNYGNFHFELSWFNYLSLPANLPYLEHNIHDIKNRKLKRLE